VTARRDTAGPVFAALADPTRRHLVRQLAETGEATATELSAELPMTRQAVSKHLAQLEDAGLVATTRAGREVRYRLSTPPLDDAMAWMAAVGARWDERLAALGRHVGTRAERTR
jgi:DNA-binding transcriptional ArsR family regulator